MTIISIHFSSNPYNASHSPLSSAMASTVANTHLICSEKSYTQRFYEATASAMSTVKGLAYHHLSPGNLLQKTQNIIKAKVLPFSNPPGWEEKMHKVEKSIASLTSIKLSLENKLRKGLLFGPQKESAEKLLEQVKTSIQRNQALVEHYQKERDAQIKSRLGSLAGNALNLAAPGVGIGTVVSTTVTAAMISAQESSAARLHEDSPITSQAKQNTRINSKLTAVCIFASTFFAWYALPTLKTMDWPLIGGLRMG